MLLRKDDLDVIAIPQPSHAWLSGQMARPWGNEHFAAPTPYDEVCLAAGQHDIGLLDWEMTPTLDAGTGLPQEFFRVPSKVHVALWREGVRRARVLGAIPRSWSRFTLIRFTRNILTSIRRVLRMRRLCALFSTNSIAFRRGRRPPCGPIRSSPSRHRRKPSIVINC